MATIHVKVMRSYDYNHFEVALTQEFSEQNIRIDIAEGQPTKYSSVTLAQATDNLRKEAARLVDKAVLQYRQRKSFEINKAPHSRARDRIAELQQEIDREIGSKRASLNLEKDRMLPESEYTPELKAKIKLVDDMRFALSREFDYDDDNFYTSVRDLFQIDADPSGE